MRSLKFTIMIAFLSGLSLFGQTRQLTLEGAINVALDHSREIQISKLEVTKAHAAVKEAYGYALPSLDLSASLNHFLEKPKTSFPDFRAMLNNSTYDVLFDENIIPYDEGKYMPMDFSLQTFAQTNSYQTQAQVTQILFNSAVFRGIGAAQVYLDLANENLKKTVANTVLNVQKAYYGVLLTRELYEIAQARFKNAQDHLKNIRAMREQGLVSEFAELQVEVQVENLRPVLLQLQNANTDATNGLKVLLDIPQEETLEITGEMRNEPEALPPEENLIVQAQESNLTLKTLKIKHHLDEVLVAIDKDGYWPTLVAFGNYGYSGSSDSWSFDNYPSSSVGLSLSFNLFQGGRTKNKVLQKHIGERQTREQIKSLTDATIMQVKSRLNDLKRVQKQTEAMEKNVALAEKAYSIAEDRFRVGEGSELEVKDADIELSVARTNYTTAIHDYLVARATLDNLVGRIDEKYYRFADEN